ncbi:hypothetical protein HDU97_004884 [Phlyctochytrium planicorne]|nr:hypothetical protein HDU97_004884 [Phlyctochytrium planicorne]
MASTSPSTSWLLSEIPLELVWDVATFLDASSLIRLSSTCKWARSTFLFAEDAHLCALTVSSHSHDPIPSHILKSFRTMLTRSTINPSASTALHELAERSLREVQLSDGNMWMAPFPDSCARLLGMVLTQDQLQRIQQQPHYMGHHEALDILDTLHRHLSSTSGSFNDSLPWMDFACDGVRAMDRRGLSIRMNQMPLSSFFDISLQTRKYDSIETLFGPVESNDILTGTAAAQQQQQQQQQQQEAAATDVGEITNNNNNNNINGEANNRDAALSRVVYKGMRHYFARSIHSKLPLHLLPIVKSRRLISSAKSKATKGVSPLANTNVNPFSKSRHPASGYFYYEVTFDRIPQPTTTPTATTPADEEPETPELRARVGVSLQNYSSHHLPGSLLDSIGYQSEDGFMALGHRDGETYQFAPSWTYGDTIGCGFIPQVVADDEDEEEEEETLKLNIGKPKQPETSSVVRVEVEMEVLDFKPGEELQTDRPSHLPTSWSTPTATPSQLHTKPKRRPTKSGGEAKTRGILFFTKNGEWVGDAAHRIDRTIKDYRNKWHACAGASVPVDMTFNLLGAYADAETGGKGTPFLYKPANEMLKERMESLMSEAQEEEELEIKKTREPWLPPHVRNRFWKTSPNSPSFDMADCPIEPLFLSPQADPYQHAERLTRLPPPPNAGLDQEQEAAPQHEEDPSRYLFSFPDHGHMVPRAIQSRIPLALNPDPKRPCKKCHNVDTTTTSSKGKEPDLPTSRLPSYFEVTILDGGQDQISFIAIGAAVRPYSPFHHVGWDFGSVGYHSDDGRVYDGTNQGGKTVVAGTSIGSDGRNQRSRRNRKPLSRVSLKSTSNRTHSESVQGTGHATNHHHRHPTHPEPPSVASSIASGTSTANTSPTSVISFALPSTPFPTPATTRRSSHAFPFPLFAPTSTSTPTTPITSSTTPTQQDAFQPLQPQPQPQPQSTHPTRPHIPPIITNRSRATSTSSSTIPSPFPIHTTTAQQQQQPPQPTSTTSTRSITLPLPLPPHPHLQEPHPDPLPQTPLAQAITTSTTIPTFQNRFGLNDTIGVGITAPASPTTHTCTPHPGNIFFTLNGRLIGGTEIDDTFFPDSDDSSSDTEGSTFDTAPDDSMLFAMDMAPPSSSSTWSYQAQGSSNGTNAGCGSKPWSPVLKPCSVVRTASRGWKLHPTISACGRWVVDVNLGQRPFVYKGPNAQSNKMP